MFNAEFDGREDVKDILEYFDVFSLNYSEEEFTAIINKLQELNTERKAQELQRAADDVRRSLKHFFELGGTICDRGAEFIYEDIRQIERDYHIAL